MNTEEWFEQNRDLEDPGAKYAGGHFITAKQLKPLKTIGVEK